MFDIVSSLNNEVSTEYHTVTVGGNLPKVEKNYPCNKAEDLPPVDYWKKRVESDDLPPLGKIQHIITTYSFAFRHIIK